MLKKILREIQKQEKEKESKILAKKKLDNEITVHSNELKQLYSLKNEFEKLENNVDDYLDFYMSCNVASKAHSKHYLPTHYIIPKSFGLNYDSMVMMEQIKVIDETRIIKYIGKLTPRFMKILDKKLMISFGLIYPKNTTSKKKVRK